MNDLAKQERKKEKKIGRIMRNGVLSAGIGVGLFFLRFLVTPFLGDNEEAQTALFIFSLCLMGYGALLILTFIFKRDWLFKINLVLTWLVFPLILLKMLMAFL